MICLQQAIGLLMDFLNQLRHAIDPNTLLTQFGYLGVFLAVFAESGLFFGFFLPGDSLLFTAGILAATGIFNIWFLIPLLFLAAFLGDQVGYWSGRTFGRKLFAKANFFLFKPEYVDRSEKFFARHGSRSIIIARFVPIVRTFTPILAGIGRMPYGTFVTYNLIGAVLWGIGMTFLGYGIGNLPGAQKYVNLIVVAIILISLIPVVMELMRHKKGPKGD